MSWVTGLISEYYSWLKNNTIILDSESSGWTLISTPFVGAFNDHIELYAKKYTDKITLSDNGETLNNLELLGVLISRSKPRQELLNSILLNYGVTQKGKELLIEFRAEDFAQKKHNFLSAILEINDFYVLSEPNVANVFKDDVRLYLDELNIVYTVDFLSKGTTGLEFKFDFQIAQRDKEIVIKAFNSLTKSNLPNFLFSWEDIKPEREKVSKKSVKAVAIVNDSKDVKPEFIEALAAKDAYYIPWSLRNSDDKKGLLAPLRQN